jgi:hypothetical protein
VTHLGFVAVSTDPSHGFTETPEKREAAAEALVREWNTYLEGDVWGYIVEEYDPTTSTWTEIDSCWGCYGLDYAKSEGRLVAEHHREDNPLLFPPPDFDDEDDARAKRADDDDERRALAHTLTDVLTPDP